MTTAIALNGQWEGLRALPRNLRTDDHRKRLENGLERLGSLYEGMAQRAALLSTGMARIDGLRSGMIDQLDAIAADADLELDEDDDRSDFEPGCEDEGGQCDDDGVDADSEPADFA